MSDQRPSQDVRPLQQQLLKQGGGRSKQQGAYKVAMLGPVQAGKTKIVAQIVGMQFPNKYEPTAGVRILELDETISTPDGELIYPVELWDCSGDQRFEACWPAICDSLDGAIVAFDPTNKAQANDVRIWCEWFAKRARLKEGTMAIFAHGELSGIHKPLSVRAGDRTLLVPILNVSTRNIPPVEEDGTQPPVPAKIEFRKFMSSVHKAWQEADEEF